MICPIVDNVSGRVCAGDPLATEKDVFIDGISRGLRIARLR